ncbi:hypothetical protein KAU92_02365 [Candidatus Bathyarchaeota archaeon]|nr:hypothetical protein [Candidatus Bathyarchaeota archaeon]
MSELIEALKGILTVVAVGIPAFLILLGFVAVMMGFTLESITGDVSTRNIGIGLIIGGVVICLIEIAVYYSRQ